MRSRSLIAICILLVLALAACSSKPADTSSSAAPAGSAPSDAASSAPSSATSSAPAKAAGGSAAAPAAAASKPAEAPAPPQPVVVPAGTTLTVRLGEALGSKISTTGESFSATLADDVEVDGKTVIPAGAAAKGTVVDAKPLGRFKGGAALEVRLTSITIDGDSHSIKTSAVMRSEKGKGKRTAVLAGGGTALGAIVGGIAGGGKGAAIGALAGAGAGGAGAAFTGNKDIVLPAEAALTFKLTAPLEVKSAK
jgi:hypothetical protein